VYNGNNSNINWGRLFHRVCCDSYTWNNGNFRLGGMMVNIYIRNKKDGKVSEDQMLSALMYVESSNNDSAYNASEDAVGCLQIRKTMVNDVNRILRKQKSPVRFTYEDRWSRYKSIKMFQVYCRYYDLTTAEEIARCWNGGPRGINNPATVGYWEKVKDKINS